MKEYFKGDFTCIDLETTGLNVNTAEIIEISATKVRNFETVDNFSSFIKPSNPIPKMITSITGITNDDVANAPQIDDVIDNIIEFIGSDVLLGHNIARYDLPILRRICCERNCSFDNYYYDTLLISQKELPELPSHRLDQLCEYYGIVNERAHRAAGDVKATIEVFIKLVENSKDNSKNFAAKNTAAHKNDEKIHRAYSKTTSAIQSLNGILMGITCDNILSESEVYYLKKWIDNNTQLKGTYPFDIIYAQISAALADGVLEQHELDNLLNLFTELLDPVENNSDGSSDICFNGKNVCLSGEFEYGSKADVSEKLSAMGAVVKESVTRTIDFLIVGGCGNDNWTCGNYGNKVKKAIEMQEKGHPIKILKESDVFIKQLL